jgi:hypothetical protein
MTPQEQHQAFADGGKVAAAWAAVGASSWSDVASMLASILSFLLILEWLWKKLLRGFCERRGWVEPKRNRRAEDSKPKDTAAQTTDFGSSL